VLQQHVEACIGLALDALAEQLENNYKTKDWSRRVKDFDLVKQLARKHSALGEFLEEYVLDPISISEIDKTPDQDLVTLITIHSAKGAEQKVCYVKFAMSLMSLQISTHMPERKVILTM